MSESQEVLRHNLNHISVPDKARYIEILRSREEFVFKSFLPVEEKCHFERYNFMHKDGKLGIVYDTKAEIFSLSAKASVLALTLSVIGCKENAGAHAEFAADGATVSSGASGGSVAAMPTKKETAPDKYGKQGKRKNGSSTKSDTPLSDAAEKKEFASRREKDNKKTQPAKSPTAKKKETAPARTVASAEKQNAVAQTQNQPATPAEPPEYKNGFSIKKCPGQRFEAILKRIRGLKGVAVTEEVANNGDKGVVSYRISDKYKQQKCLLRYASAKQTVQLQGKWSNLFGEVQVILNSGSGFKEAVDSHMELTGESKRASTVQRSLRKLLPDAFELLSEQSKINLGIGMVDIGNQEVKLSDYSVLLVPPYRGLERFIFDLQQARGIAVKMIGQAYEKDDLGRYRLKGVYRKKMGIVYSEVMSALYTEYFEKRNFYAHSDNTDDSGMSRVIGDKATAKSIFDHLCEIINYNGKKLKEIGFTMEKEKN